MRYGYSQGEHCGKNAVFIAFCKDACACNQHITKGISDFGLDMATGEPMQKFLSFFLCL